MRSKLAIALVVALAATGAAFAGSYGKPAADIVWFTPSVARPDPCEEMQRQMKGKSGGG